MNEVKPGWRCSEFWLSTAAVLIGAITASGLVPEGHIAWKILGVAASVLAALGYTVARTVAKRPPPAAVLLPLVLVLALAASGCCSTARCYLARGLPVMEAADKIALPAISEACKTEVAKCGKVERKDCPAMAKCENGLLAYRVAMDSIGRALAAANRALEILGVQ